MGVGVCGGVCRREAMSLHLRKRLPIPEETIAVDIEDGISVSGYGHPSCRGGMPSDQAIKALRRRPSSPSCAGVSCSTSPSMDACR
jgi:hypothetical protein